MNFYSVWPYFAGMVIVLFFAGTALLRWAETPPHFAPSRVATIDGLRGFLALSVVFHHGALYHLYLQTGTWGSPPSRFYGDLGATGVAMFFMITGYLFWTQLLVAKGKPNFPKLYTGRLFRIVPLYMFLAITVLLMVGFLTQWQLREPPVKLAKHIGRWLAGGMVVGFDVNGFRTGQTTSYVTWTLHYEWVFYGSLLVTSFFARKLLWGFLFPMTVLLIVGSLLIFYPSDMSFAAPLMFSIGMAAASAKTAAAGRSFTVPQWVRSTAALGCIACVLLFFDDVYTTLPVLILGMAFVLIVFDATIFGVLLSEPAKRLGNISYGIYLLQGPILFVLFTLPSVQPMIKEYAWAHWAIVMFAVLVLLLVATATHVLIERPGIRAGQLAWAKMASHLSVPGKVGV